MVLIGCYFRDILYLCLLLTLSPVIGGFYLYRRIMHGRYKMGWSQKFGGSPVCSPEQQRIWIHAVSLGEVNAMSSLVAEIMRQRPKIDIVISTTTDTGFDRATTLYGERHTVFIFPIDFTWCLQRSIAKIAPTLCIMMEGEVWPNFTAVAKYYQLPVIVANGRVGGTKGWPRYQRLAPLFRAMFKRVSLVLAQDEIHGNRFCYLGVLPENMKVVGALKYDTAEIVNRVEGAEALADQLAIDKDDLVFVAGSTGPGEEEMILNTFKALQQCAGFENAICIIVPRKPERFEQVAALISAARYGVVKYSDYKATTNRLPPNNQAINPRLILGDTMGDLRKFYSLATVVFVGRSLVDMGGSDMLEVAALAKPIVVGQYTYNFEQTMHLLTKDKAICIATGEQSLTEAVVDLFTQKEAAAEMAHRARMIIVQNTGATERSATEIFKLLDRDIC